MNALVWRCLRQCRNDRRECRLCWRRDCLSRFLDFRLPLRKEPIAVLWDIRLQGCKQRFQLRSKEPTNFLIFNYGGVMKFTKCSEAKLSKAEERRRADKLFHYEVLGGCFHYVSRVSNYDQLWQNGGFSFADKLFTFSTTAQFRISPWYTTFLPAPLFSVLFF